MCVCRQRAGCLIAAHLTACWNKGPSPASWVPQLTPSCYFHVQRALAHCHAPPWQVNCYLVMTVCRETGHFPPLCLNRCSSLCVKRREGGRDGAGFWVGAEGRNYHISGWTGVPPLVWIQKHTALCWPTVGFHSPHWDLWKPSTCLHTAVSIYCVPGTMLQPWLQ